MTFYGEFRGKHDRFDHAHEPEKTMLIPLLVLSLGAIFVGMIFYGKFVGKDAGNFFHGAIFNHSDNHVLHDFHYVPNWVKLSPFVAMLAGFYLAFNFYILNTRIPVRLSHQHSGLYKFLYNKWYFDEIFNFLIIKPVLFLGEILWKWGDGNIIDGSINRLTLGLIPRLTNFYAKLQSGFLFINRVLL